MEPEFLYKSKEKVKTVNDFGKVLFETQPAPKNENFWAVLILGSLVIIGAIFLNLFNIAFVIAGFLFLTSFFLVFSKISEPVDQLKITDQGLVVQENNKGYLIPFEDICRIKTGYENNKIVQILLHTHNYLEASIPLNEISKQSQFYEKLIDAWVTYGPLNKIITFFKDLSKEEGLDLQLADPTNKESSTILKGKINGIPVKMELKGMNPFFSWSMEFDLKNPNDDYIFWASRPKDHSIIKRAKAAKEVMNLNLKNKDFVFLSNNSSLFGKAFDWQRVQKWNHLIMGYLDIFAYGAYSLEARDNRNLSERSLSNSNEESTNDILDLDWVQSEKDAPFQIKEGQNKLFLSSKLLNQRSADLNSLNQFIQNTFHFMVEIADIIKNE